MSGKDTADTGELFDGVEEARNESQTGQTTQPEVVDSSNDSGQNGSLTSEVDQETVADIVKQVADTYKKNQEDKREHNRSVLKMEMIYNASILGVLASLILVLSFVAGLDPIIGFTFIAGIATGFGTNTALTSLSQ